MSTRDKTQWESLDPFDKATQWVKMAPEIAPQLVEMVRVVADHRREVESMESQHRREMEREQAEHERLMDKRLWIAHLVAMSINTLGMGLLCVLAIRFGKDAVAPAVAVVGAGGGLTAGSYLAGRSIRRTWVAAKKAVTSGIPDRNSKQ